MKKLTNNVWFKCISFLLILSALLSGILAVLNTVLFVPPEERTERALQKIYGEARTIDDIILDVDNGDEAYTLTDCGKINKIYKIGNDTLFQAVGEKGFNNGTVTLWINVTENNGKLVISKVVLDSSVGQSFIGSLSAAFFDGFLVDVTESYEKGKFTANPLLKDNADVNFNPVSGASNSGNAACNAVNTVLHYINQGGAK